MAFFRLRVHLRSLALFRPSPSFLNSAPAASPGLSPRLTLMLALACGLCVANLYYAQPLIGPIAEALALPTRLAGVIMTLTQLGYAAGLLLLVPLSDAVENRRLVVTLLGGLVFGLVGVAVSTSATTFLLASLVVGLCAVTAQILLPFASMLAPEANRGRLLGTIMAGLLAGIMLARPFSSMVASLLGWRAVFAISAALVVVLTLLLWRALPQRRPQGASSYWRTMATLPALVRDTPLLRRRAFYQGMLFGSFQVFWTAVPLLLTQRFGFDQQGIALFALAGAAGALTARWAGNLADRGHTRFATGALMWVTLAGFAIAALAAPWHSVVVLIAGALLIDGAVQMSQILSIRSIYMLAPEQRGRLNGLYMTFVFLCAALASGLAPAAVHVAGLDGTVRVGRGVRATGAAAVCDRAQGIAKGAAFYALMPRRRPAAFAASNACASCDALAHRAPATRPGRASAGVLFLKGGSGAYSMIN